jgi:hypothetical protein
MEMKGRTRRKEEERRIRGGDRRRSLLFHLLISQETVCIMRRTMTIKVTLNYALVS